MEKSQEKIFMLAFINESYMDEEIARDQLRALWTAYCLHHNLDVDTADYDRDLTDLWKAIAGEYADDEDTADTGDWHDFDSFDNFMCRYLV